LPFSLLGEYTKNRKEFEVWGCPMKQYFPLGEKTLEVEIPRLVPGMLFSLEKPVEGDSGAPIVAVLSCPRCGINSPATNQQVYNGAWMICGGDRCSAEFKLEEEDITYRAPQ
jgi:hypothetical protein